MLQCTGGRANRIIDTSWCSFLSISAAFLASLSQVSVLANISPWIHQDYHYAQVHQIGQALFKINSLCVKSSACIVSPLHHKNQLSGQILQFILLFPLISVIPLSLRFERQLFAVKIEYLKVRKRI